MPAWVARLPARPTSLYGKRLCDSRLPVGDGASYALSCPQRAGATASRAGGDTLATYAPAWMTHALVGRQRPRSATHRLTARGTGAVTVARRSRGFCSLHRRGRPPVWSLADLFDALVAAVAVRDSRVAAIDTLHWIFLPEMQKAAPGDGAFLPPVIKPEGNYG